MSPTYSSGRLICRLSYICSSCSRNLRTRGPARDVLGQRRWIGLKYLAKTEDAKKEWDEKGREIQAGKRDSMLTILEKRGYIDSIVGTREDLDKLMIEKRIGAYVGFDPTASSLHVGHLLPLMALFWMYVHGFQAVTLLGGATAQIGDPTGRTTSRDMPASAIRKANMANMHMQLKRLWGTMEQYTALKHGYKWEWAWRRALKNNNEWLNKLTVLEFLKLLGTGTRVGPMLGKDTVRNKMTKGDGMSFAELTYPLLQAWDWWHMYKVNGVQLQIGGSDQFGNILAGMDGVNYIRKNHYHPDVRQETDKPEMRPMGFTVPLLTTASGKKFGKSEGNPIWLDKDQTSVFDQYQFFIRTADADVARFLRFFTFIPIPEIDEIMAQHEKDASQRIAQRRLAREIMEMIHGQVETDLAEKEAKVLFARGTTTTKTTLKAKIVPNYEAHRPPKHNSNPADINYLLNKDAPQITASNAPSTRVTLPRSLVFDQSIARVIYSAGLVASRSEGHRLAFNRGVYVGGQMGNNRTMTDSLKFTPMHNWAPDETKKYVIDDSLLILRVGKWKIKIVTIVPDADFEARGLDCPGWQEWKQGRRRFEDEELFFKEAKREIENDKLAKAGIRKGSGVRRSLQAKLDKQWSPADKQRLEDFMQEAYEAPEGKKPDFAEWLRRESIRKEKEKAEKPKKVESWRQDAGKDGGKSFF